MKFSVLSALNLSNKRDSFDSSINLLRALGEQSFSLDLRYFHSQENDTFLYQDTEFNLTIHKRPICIQQDATGAWNEQCVLQEVQKNLTGYFVYCSCKFVRPTTAGLKQNYVYVMNTKKNDTNATTSPSLPSVVGDTLKFQFYFNFNFYLFSSLILIYVLIVFKLRTLDQQEKERFQDFRNEDSPIGKNLQGLTEQQKNMTVQSAIIKRNFKYLHEFSSIYFIYDYKLSRANRSLLRLLHIQLDIALSHILLLILPLIGAIPMLILGDLMLQLLIKILEGFYYGDTKIFKAVGYIITSILLIGASAAIIFVDDIETFDNIYWLIVFVASFLIIISLIEYVIVTLRVKLYFRLKPLLEIDHLNPILNCIYYFLQQSQLKKLYYGFSLDD